MRISEILHRIDHNGLDENLLKELDEEISNLKLKDKSIIVDQTEKTTIRYRGLPPISVIYEVEGPHTSFSLIRKYVTKKNIEDLLSS